MIRFGHFCVIPVNFEIYRILTRPGMRVQGTYENSLLNCKSFRRFGFVFVGIDEKTNNVVSEHARHKPSCTSTEDGYWKFWTLKVEELYSQHRENKGADQLPVTAKLLCVFIFAYLQEVGFLMMRLNFS